MQQIKAEDVAEHFDDLLKRVMDREEVIILKDDQPVAQISPVTQQPKRRKPGSAKGLVWTSDDFDDPLPEFSEDRPHPRFGSAAGQIWMSDDFDDPLPEVDDCAS